MVYSSLIPPSEPIFQHMPAPRGCTDDWAVVIKQRQDPNSSKLTSLPIKRRKQGSSQHASLIVHLLCAKQSAPLRSRGLLMVQM